jgi:hypothetical protein
LDVGNEAFGAGRDSLQVEGVHAVVFGGGRDGEGAVFDLEPLGLEVGEEARLEDVHAVVSFGCGNVSFCKINVNRVRRAYNLEVVIPAGVGQLNRWLCRHREDQQQWLGTKLPAF